MEEETKTLRKRRRVKVDEDLREKLADLEHEQWSHWEKYREGAENKLNADGYPNRDNWRRQRATSYLDLTEKEKDSDREWADKVLEVFEGFIDEMIFGVETSMGEDNFYDDGYRDALLNIKRLTAKNNKTEVSK